MRRKKLYRKKIMKISLAAALSLILACGGMAPAGPTEVPGMVQAAEQGAAAEGRSGSGTGTAQGAEAGSVSGKDEVVYAVLDAAGSLNGIYVVNCLNVTEAGTVEDYGTYSQVKNLTDTSELDYKDGVIRIQAEQGRFYYQGNQTDGRLPWEISVSYRLDGKTVAAEDAAGQSGHLEITIDTAPGTTGTEFFENYLLQISLTLDTGKCADIQAPDASLADAGEDKQITFTGMPGREGHFTVSADVTEFEMDGISIAAVPFSMAIDLPDMASMTDQLGELSDGILQIDEGAAQLEEGARSLAEGSGALKDGSASYEEGLNTFAFGASSLREGGMQFAGGLGQLTEGAFGLSGGMQQYWDGLKAFISGLESLKEGSGQYRSGMEYTAGQSKGLTDGSLAIRDGLSAVSEQLRNSLAAGMGDGAGGTEALQALPEGLRQFADGLESVQGGLLGAADGCSMLTGSLDSMIGTFPEISEEAIAALGTDNETVNQLVSSYRSSQALKMTWSSIKGGLDQTGASLGEMAASLGVMAASLDSMAEQIEAALGDGTMEELLAGLQALSQGLDTLAAQYGSFHEGLTAYTEGIKTLAASYGSIDDGLAETATGAQALGDGCGQVLTGAQGLAAGLKETEDGFGSLLSGIVSLTDGAGALADGYSGLSEGIVQLTDGTGAVSDGIGSLAEGTGQLRLATEDMPEKIQEEIDRLISQYDKSDFVPVSFVSEKNENVELVQFVITTEGIAAEEEVEEEAPPEKEKTIWDRFLDLFR